MSDVRISFYYHRIFLLGSLLFGILNGTYAQEDWKQIRDKEGITVFTRSNQNMDFKEFRSVMLVDGTVDQFLSVLYDVDGLESWGYNVKSASLIRRESDSIQIYYAVAKAPFPYKNRDGVYLNRFSWDRGAKKLSVDIELVDDLVPTKDNLVRMEGYGLWEVIEMANGKLQVIFQMQMDPGGSIPAWMANMFAGDSPYYTLYGLREAMGDKKYQGKTYSFIRDPSFEQDSRQ